MAKKRLTGNNKTLSDDWEETLRQIRTQTAVDFTMTGEEKARKLRELEADPIAWAKFMFYRYAKYEFAGFQKKAIRRIIGHSDGNWYEVLSWARELAKSTIVMFIVLYLVICGVAGVLRWVVGWLPVVGWVIRILCWLIGVYCLAGIVLAIVDCVRQ